MKFEVNIDKKFAFMIFGAILILAGAIYGYAYGGNTPAVMGHSLGEIDVETSYYCGNGEYVKSIDLETGSVVCETDDVGSVESFGTLINSLPNGPVILKNGEEFSKSSVDGSADNDRIVDVDWWTNARTYKLSEFPFPEDFSSILPSGLSSEITHVEVTTIAKYMGNGQDDRLFVYSSKSPAEHIYPMIIFNVDDDGDTYGTNWHTNNQLIPIDDWNGIIYFYQDNTGVTNSNDKVLFIVTGYVIKG